MFTQCAAPSGETKKTGRFSIHHPQASGKEHTILDVTGSQGLFDRIKGFPTPLCIHGEIQKEHQVRVFMADVIHLPRLSKNHILVSEIQ